MVLGSFDSSLQIDAIIGHVEFMQDVTFLHRLAKKSGLNNKSTGGPQR